MAVIYFNTEYAIGVHDTIIDVSGGLTGIKDQGQLESILEHIQNDMYYPEFADKLTHLMFAVNKFHAFNDGNKRSSIGLAAYFLTINGYEHLIEHFIKEMENIVVWVAEGKISKDLLHEILSSLISEDEYSESLKLDIMRATEI
jgi:death on curing protein